MKVLVICRPASNVDRTAFAALLPREAAALRDLRAAGTLVEAWSPGGPGAILMLESPSERETAALVAGLPLAAAGLITTEVVPLHPLTL